MLRSCRTMPKLRPVSCLPLPVTTVQLAHTCPWLGVHAYNNAVYIRSDELCLHSGASLKLSILNPKGRIWTMVAGGGKEMYNHASLMPAFDQAGVLPTSYAD